MVQNISIAACNPQRACNMSNRLGAKIESRLPVPEMIAMAAPRNRGVMPSICMMVVKETGPQPLLENPITQIKNMIPAGTEINAIPTAPTKVVMTGMTTKGRLDL